MVLGTTTEFKLVTSSGLSMPFAPIPPPTPPPRTRKEEFDRTRKEELDRRTQIGEYIKSERLKSDNG